MCACVCICVWVAYEPTLPTVSASSSSREAGMPRRRSEYTFFLVATQAVCSRLNPGSVFRGHNWWDSGDSLHYQVSHIQGKQGNYSLYCRFGTESQFCGLSVSSVMAGKVGLESGAGCWDPRQPLLTASKYVPQGTAHKGYTETLPQLRPRALEEGWAGTQRHPDLDLSSPPPLWGHWGA